MSLCTAFFDSGNILVCADSRVSSEVNGKHYFVTDHYNKIRKFGDKVVFISGEVEIVERIFGSIKKQTTIKQIVRNTKKYYTEFSEKNKNSATYKGTKYGIEIGVYVFKIENGIPIFYQMGYSNNHNNGKLFFERQVANDKQLSAVAAYSTKALPYIQNLVEKGMELEKAILETYEHFSDEIVGGYLHTFIITKDNIIRRVEKIKDDKEYPKWQGMPFPYHSSSTFHADMLGNVTASALNMTGGKIKLGNVLEVDESGITIAGNADITGNINMTGGSINWGSVGKPSYNPSEIGALATNSPMLTHISPTGIYTGTLSANQINAGKINSQYIDTENLRVSKISATNNPNHYAEVGGNYGDLTLYGNNTEFFQIYNQVTGAITLRSYGESFMTVGQDGVHFTKPVHGVVARFA